MSVSDRLRKLAEAAPDGPWTATGGYPQAVTNPAAILVAEIFDSPDVTPSTAPLIALAPELAAWAADAANELRTQQGQHSEWADVHPEASTEELRIGALLARLDAILPAEPGRPGEVESCNE